MPTLTIGMILVSKKILKRRDTPRDNPLHRIDNIRTVTSYIDDNDPGTSIDLYKVDAIQSISEITSQTKNTLWLTKDEILSGYCILDTP